MTQCNLGTCWSLLMNSNQLYNILQYLVSILSPEFLQVSITSYIISIVPILILLINLVLIFNFCNLTFYAVLFYDELCTYIYVRTLKCIFRLATYPHQFNKGTKKASRVSSDTHCNILLIMSVNLAVCFPIYKSLSNIHTNDKAAFMQ